MSAIELREVWKSYPRWDRPRTLREIARWRLPGVLRGGERRWALRDVSLRVEPGESVGLIGVNGAGKSTLLRLAAGLTASTRGEARVPPDTLAVLSLGDTLDPELTGRENAMTAAVVAGMRRAQARERLDDMFAFSELEAFADAPVRTYSDGMRLRLAFSVVAQFEPGALLLDEVLAVGDLRFQARCMEHVRRLRERGMTFLFASHALDEVVAQCDRAVWLQAGGVRALGEAAAVVAEYRDAMRSDTLAVTPAPEAAGERGDLELRRNRFGSQELTIESVALRGADGREADEIPSGAPLSVDLELRARGASTGPEPVVGVAVHRLSDGVVCVDTSTEAAGVRVGAVPRAGRTVSVRFERLDLLPGEYAIDVGAYREDWAHAYDFHWQAYPLRVVGSNGEGGVFRAPARWTVGGAPGPGALEA